MIHSNSCVCINYDQVLKLIIFAFAGDDSSNEDQGEERAAGDGEVDEKIKKADDGASELAAVPEEENMEEGDGDSEEEKEMKTEESEEFSFPDTTISLSHLQPSR